MRLFGGFWHKGCVVSFLIHQKCKQTSLFKVISCNSPQTRQFPIGHLYVYTCTRYLLVNILLTEKEREKKSKTTFTRDFYYPPPPIIICHGTKTCKHQQKKKREKQTRLGIWRLYTSFHVQWCGDESCNENLSWYIVNIHHSNNYFHSTVIN